MEKRTILALVLSLFVVFAFQKFAPPPTAKEPVLGEEKVTAPIENTYKPEQDQPYTPKKIVQNEAITPYNTGKYDLEFSNIGGAIRSIRVANYDMILVKDLPAPYAVGAISLSGLGANYDKVGYKLEEYPDHVIYEYSSPNNPLIIRKDYHIQEGVNYIELNISFQNKGPVPISLDYTIGCAANLEKVTSIKGRNYIETNAMVDGKYVGKKRIKGSKEIIRGIIDWAAVKNRYFAIALKPLTDGDMVVIEKDQNKQLSVGIGMKKRQIQPNEIISDNYVIYAGPLSKKVLGELDLGMEGLVNYGLLGGIISFLIFLLGKINIVVHNWGASIILLTVCINIVLFPLTKKSFLSMQRMQAIQPHMEKLKQLHKDNPQKLNKEMMGLYKEYNVNPFGGCLPMLLQMPIFISFYQALMRSIELKNEQFLWIKDLSSPDALFTFPQSLPILGDSFNVLPLITLIVMMIQQKLVASQSAKTMSPEMAQQQKMMALIFPIFFGFILYNFPAGLVLYWLTNSSLMAAEQFFMRKQATVVEA